jgi:hypothetical protein
LDRVYGRGTLAIVTFVLLLLPTALHARAEKRIALLIGNRAYDASVGVLKNPHNVGIFLRRTVPGIIEEDHQLPHSS